MIFKKEEGGACREVMWLRGERERERERENGVSYCEKN
jgi:hypothetical protein